MAKQEAPSTRPWHRRPAVAALVLMVVYLGLALLMSDGGSLGTDTGAKVATLEVMDQRDSWRPQVGYWAAEWDPDGRLHPLYQSTPVDGDYVAVTTLPMLLLAHPLYDIGGYRLALLLPMLGAVGAAFGCRALATRLAGDDAGWLTFWVVGLASPMTVYALDFWEHAPGAALMVWAAVHMLDFARAVGRWWSPVTTGALLGAAATMRSEAFVAAAVIAGAGALARLVTTRSIREPLFGGVGAFLGFVPVWLANGALEHALGGQSRSARAEGLVAGSGFELGERVSEGLTTTIAIVSNTTTASRLVGLCVVASVMLAFHLTRIGQETLARGCSVVAVLLLALPALDGLGFVPGALVAFPAAAVGLLAVGAGGTKAWVALAALVAYPLTWGFQYLGGSLPQWGGRYTLGSTLVLATCGLCLVQERSPQVRMVLVAPCVAVTAMGVAWLGVRSYDVERVFDALSERPEDVVVAANSFFAREGMDAYVERRWLAPGAGVTLADVAQVVDDAGLSSFVLVGGTEEQVPRVGDFELSGTEAWSFLDQPMYLHSYEAP